MNDQIVETQSYHQFFEEQGRSCKRLDRRRVGIGVLFALSLLALLGFLKSPPGVWAVVTGLYGVAFYGLHRLHITLRVTQLALSDLEALARYLAAPRSREELTAYVKSQIAPNESNVPEAISALCSGSSGGEGVRAAANAAFSQPASELSVAQFIRTALVLGGLFGTVLFFAIELGDPSLLRGNLDALLPGIRGALASTLTGILGSVAVGYLASAIDQMIERSVWETESLLSGPFTNALAVLPDRVDVVNEVQLWQKLIEEVGQLRRDTATSYAALGNDVSTHAVALQELGRQLADLPAVQVPPQLANLQDVVRDFRNGADLLNTTVTTLVGAVSTLGLYAPAKTLDELSSIKATLTVAQERTDRKLDGISDAVGVGRAERRAHREPSVDSKTRPIRRLSDVAEAIGAGNAQLRSDIQGVAVTTADVPALVAAEVRGSLEEFRAPLGRVERTVDELSPLLARIDERTNELTNQLGMLQKHRGLAEGAGAGGPMPSDKIGAVAAVSSDTVPTVWTADQVSQSTAVFSGADLMLAKLQAIGHAMAQVPEDVRSAAATVAASADAVRSAEDTLRTQSQRMSTALDDVASYKASLAEVGDRLRLVQAWHERAARAPLMKLLLLRFGRAQETGTANGA